ncbi:MAG: hypothetical protein LBS36_00340 [Oscillospiraceae bacterium]|jgi:hypothetical protein|nr:hypothetical protein [Oscillospiraceae bacterium]
MKKMIALLLACLFALGALSGCSGEDSPASKGATAQAQDKQSSDSGKKTTSDAGEIADLSNGEVDVDLTKLTSILVYSEVNNMVNYPARYLGKVIKMKGMYSTEFWEETKKDYHYVVIADATACCQQGLEFIWNGDHKVPEDYPEFGAEVEMAGIFKSYEEQGKTWYYIAVDDITLL